MATPRDQRCTKRNAAEGGVRDGAERVDAGRGGEKQFRHLYRGLFHCLGLPFWGCFQLLQCCFLQCFELLRHRLFSDCSAQPLKQGRFSVAERPS